jgi:hypothetical protein
MRPSPPVGSAVVRNSASHDRETRAFASIGARRAGFVVVLLMWASSARAQDTAPATRAESEPASRPATQPAAAASQPAAAPAASPASESRPCCEAVCDKKLLPWDLTGSVSLSYRGRATEGASDNDVYGYLTLDGGNPDVDDAIFHMMGRLTYDFDNDADDKGNPFGSLNDVSGKPYDSHLYEAWVDLRPSILPRGFQRARIGRQDVYGAFTYLVDGARVDFERLKCWGDVRFSLVGGIPEYLYEDSRSGDWLVGADANFRPWRDGVVDLHYVHVADENAWVDQETDDYLQVAVRQKFSDCFLVSAYWDTIDLGTRDAWIHFDWLSPRTDFEIHGTYRYQATITNEYTTIYDPYVGVLGTSYAYHQIELDASKLFCNEKLGLDGGVSARILQDRSNESAFNHEFARLWLTASTYGWPRKDIDLSMTGELWAATGENTSSLGGEVTWRANDKLKFIAGTYYSLYKHDLFVVDERDDVTTIFIRGTWRPRDGLRFDGRLEFETTGNEGNFITAVFAATWSF